MIKQIILGLASLGSLPALASVIQADSFATVNVDTGYGRLSDESAVPYGLGAGYQWNIQDNTTAGVEGAYFYNGSVTHTGTAYRSYEWAPLLSLYYYPGNAVNFFGKVGYGWQVNHMGADTSEGWTPVAVGGVGYTIPLSAHVFLNLYTDLTWSGDKQHVLAGSSLNQNTQIKAGLQVIF